MADPGSFRKAKGAVIRPSPEWFGQVLMGGSAFQSNVAAQFSYVGLFNDATDGSYLVVVAIDGLVFNSNSTNLIRTTKGNPGTIITGNANPIDPTQSAGPGKIIGFNSAAVIGALIFETGGAAQPQPDPWAHPWPICYLPPGYSLLSQGATLNIGSKTAFQWYPTQTPY